MRQLSRRRFITLAGVGSALLAATGSGVFRVLEKVRSSSAPQLTPATRPRTFRFRAVAGLPERPLPSYASFVLEGDIDLAASTGTVTRTVFAGAPQARSTIELPGLARVLRVTGVQGDAASLRIQAAVDDPGALRPGESVTSMIRVDPANGVVVAPLLHTDHVLQLVSPGRA